MTVTVGDYSLNNAGQFGLIYGAGQGHKNVRILEGPGAIKFDARQIISRVENKRQETLRILIGKGKFCVTLKCRENSGGLL